jgi:hypothetical protein
MMKWFPYDTENERYCTGIDYRLDEDVSFKSVRILTTRNAGRT